MKLIFFFVTFCVVNATFAFGQNCTSHKDCIDDVTKRNCCSHNNQCCSDLNHNNISDMNNIGEVEFCFNEDQCKESGNKYCCQNKRCCSMLQKMNESWTLKILAIAILNIAVVLCIAESFRRCKSDDKVNRRKTNPYNRLDEEILV